MSYNPRTGRHTGDELLEAAAAAGLSMEEHERRSRAALRAAAVVTLRADRGMLDVRVEGRAPVRKAVERAAAALGWQLNGDGGDGASYEAAFRTEAGPVGSMAQPSTRKASSITRVSSESSSSSTCVGPSLSAASISTRLEMLLEPGRRTRPPALLSGGRSRLGMANMGGGLSPGA